MTMQRCDDPALLSGRLKDYPDRLVKALLRMAERQGRELYVVGGTVRDWLLGRVPGDLDITVARDAAACCRGLIAELKGGTFVPLGCAEDDTGRVVWKGMDIDFSGFRLGARTIEADLGRRDFTVNSIGVALVALLDESVVPHLIDPLHGVSDLQRKVLRACPQAFVDDPLRMLRGYRLSATLGFTLDEATRAEIAGQAGLISRAAAERITYELDLIMATGRAHAVIKEMAASGLLWHLIPDLAHGVGMEQPGFHHLDVFHHSLAALGFMEEILAEPPRFYPESAAEIGEYLDRPGIQSRLKWAALLHDLGKPVTMAIREDKGGRVTFYGHDQTGRDMVLQLGRQWRWGKENRERVAGLIAMHMQPFHLCNVRRDGPLSRKACLHLCKKAGDDLIGLFLLAMADSLAGKGEKKPPGLEAELSGLLAEILEIQTQYIQPALHGPRLLSGEDLIASFSLSPGPLFANILEALELARVEGAVTSREDALRWVQQYLSDM
jgi:poly(A) polymerase